MSPLRQLLIVAAVAAMSAGVWFAAGPLLTGDSSGDGDGGGRRRGAGQPAPVIVEPVKTDSDAAVIEAVGTARAVRHVTLFPEAAGRVTELGFNAGERVEDGQTLLRLDTDDQELAVERARLQLQDARQRLARYEQVSGSGAVAESEVDQARSAVALARVQLSEAELALARRTVTAPFAGVMGMPQVDVGDRVNESTAIASLDDRSTLRVEFDVPETFARGIAEGDTVEAETWSRPRVTATGTIEAVASRIDPETRTLRVRAAVPNPEDRLRPGMSFAVRIALAGRAFPAVPASAVHWGNEGAVVWRVVDGSAERVLVNVLKRSGTSVLVDAPLATGDRIVVEGVQRLRPGVAVEVQQREGELARLEQDDGG